MSTNLHRPTSTRGPIVIGALSLVVGVLMVLIVAWVLAAANRAAPVPEALQAGPYAAPKARLFQLIIDGTLRAPGLSTDWVFPLWGGLGLGLIALGIGQVRARRWARALTPWWATAMLAAVAAATVVMGVNADLRGDPVGAVLAGAWPMFVLAVHPIVLCVVATRRSWRAAFE